MTNRRSDRGLVDSYVLRTTRDGSAAQHTVLSKLRDVDAPVLLTASECMDHLIAGIDTTGDGLCHLLYYLSLPAIESKRVQTALQAELVENFGAPIDSLPYLDAVVKESLRLFTPIPMSLPRVVPAGGRTICGVALPAGTIVNCQAYTLHRLDEAVFPHPNEYVPERWLTEEGAVERNQLFFAFAAGGRGCIGKQ